MHFWKMKMHKEKTTKKKLPKVRVSFTEIIRLLIYEHIITDQCSVIYHMAVDIKTAFCSPPPYKKKWLQLPRGEASM
jgi:hypothetical protein